MYSNDLIRKVIKAVDADIARLRKTRAVLTRLNGTATNPSNVVPINAKRHMSAAARKRIGDAQRLRWANVRKGTRRG